jgi:hypothetical protein
MNAVRSVIAGLTLLCLMYVPAAAQDMLAIKIGPVWPREIRETERPTAWDAEIGYVRLFDKMIGFGAEVDFLWNRYEEDTTQEGTVDTTTVKLRQNTYLMFPVSGVIVVDPLQGLVVRPVLRGTFGFNMMVNSSVQYDSLGKEIESPKNGFYYGVIGTAGLDAMYDFGEHASVFAGLEYQWATAKKKKKGTENQYYEPKLSGLGIRMGLRFLL